MKKNLPAAALIILAASAIVAAATSRHSRANNHYPNEWEQTCRPAADSNEASLYSNKIINQ
jgi:hypothetical protein